MLTGGYYGIKYAVYSQIIAKTKFKIEYKNIKLTLFPLGIRINDVHNFPLKNKSVASFQSLNVVFPVSSLLDKKKVIYLEIIKPQLTLDEKIFEKSDLETLDFTIQKLKILAGKLHYKSSQLNADVEQIDMTSQKKSDGTSFYVSSPAATIFIKIENEYVAIHGSLVGELRELDTFFKINHLTLRSNTSSVQVFGKIFKENTFNLNCHYSGPIAPFLTPILADLAPSANAYVDAQCYKTKQKKIAINASITADLGFVAKHPINKIHGNLNWDNGNNKLELECFFINNGTPAKININNQAGKTELLFKMVHGELLTDLINIRSAIPFDGLVSDGKAVFDKTSITGTAELIFPVITTKEKTIKLQGAGQVYYIFDKKTKQTEFWGKNIDVHAGLVTIWGLNDALNHSLALEISATITHLEYVNPFAQYYVDMDLHPWGLEQGNGIFNLSLKRQAKNLMVYSSFNVKNFRSNAQTIVELDGDVTNLHGLVKGNFKINDPELNGKAEMTLENHVLQLHFADFKGEAQKAMKILDFDIPVKGQFQGHFDFTNYLQTNEKLTRGSFSAAQLFFSNYCFDHVQSDLLSHKNDTRLTNLTYQYCSGKGSGEIYINKADQEYDINTVINAIDINKIASSITGKGKIEARGKGHFDLTPIAIRFDLEHVSYFQDREFQIHGYAQVFTNFKNYTLHMLANLEKPDATSSLQLNLQQQNDIYSGDYTGYCADINLVMPWKGNSGDIKIKGDISTDSLGKMNTKGYILFAGESLTFPNFSHSLNQYQGDITFLNRDFTLNSFNAEIGGSQVNGNGNAHFSTIGLDTLDLNLSGKNMELFLLDRTKCRMNADLRLNYMNEKLLLSGNIQVLSGEWQREITEGISFYTKSELSPAESRLTQILEFDHLHMKADNNIYLNNSLVRARGSFNLDLIGSPSFPVVVGTIESSEGEILFSDHHFKLLKGKLIFNNRSVNDPIIQVESETSIQSYLVKLNVSGKSSGYKPEFISSPPLSPPDILALVTMGEFFKRPGSAEISSQIGTTSMVFSKVTDEIKKRFNRVLGIDLLRFDPNLSANNPQGESRLTIGKSISKDILIVYSTNFVNEKQPILYIQYQLSPGIVLIGMKNEDGVYSLDLRIRKTH